MQSGMYTRELFAGDVGGFRLVAETAVDGERVARERAAAEARRVAFAASQSELLVEGIDLVRGER